MSGFTGTGRLFRLVVRPPTVEQEIDAEIEFPGDFRNEQLAGKRAQVSFKIVKVQEPKLPPSSLHSKLATPLPPASVPLKVNDAELLLLGFDGLVLIVVSGAIASVRFNPTTTESWSDVRQGSTA